MYRRLPADHAHPDVAVRSSARPVTVRPALPSHELDATRPVERQVPQPVKDLARPGHDADQSRWRIPAVAGVPWLC